MRFIGFLEINIIAFFIAIYGAHTISGIDVQKRITNDILNGKPIVIHVIVLLCDNQYQRINPVPNTLGNGQNPDRNLYWGALYGVQRYLSREANWEIILREGDTDEGILERIVLFNSLRRNGKKTPVYIVAEAWDGREAESAVLRFLSISAGYKEEK